MLELKNIVKDYPAGNDVVHALKGVSLSFRENEFVSILGPSGCGKTTMLNIIGGLDSYTDGDLVINGKSTKDFKDRDWDTYRNHSIGFVFQSYNLIPHQTVLQNVELALTLSGVGKKERRARAAAALEEVGLGDQLNKRPSEMSGGQMQRVAIARALVNNPDIVLLDEPTGALDTETGIMVMEILKKVASNRLIIMVTHNPELAYQYSTRIVKMLDGRVLDDSMPLTPEEESYERTLAVEKAKQEAQKKIPRMKYATSFGLSLKNLFTKKGRTALTAFAGSIGIIGIALIYAVSQGTENYIDTVQQDALSSYPLSISKETADMGSMMTSMADVFSNVADDPKEGYITELNITSGMFGGIGTNDLASFKRYMEDHWDEIGDDISNLQYTYNIAPQIYTHDVNGKILKVNPSSMLSSMMGGSMGVYGSMMAGGLFNVIRDDSQEVRDQYEVLAGRWPEKRNEMILVLTDDNHITDFMEYAIGLKDQAELRAMMEQVMSGNTVSTEQKGERKTYSYEELLDLDFCLLEPADLYRFNREYSVWEDMSSDTAFMETAYDKGLKLTVTGILCPKEDSSGGLGAGICYLPALTDYIMARGAAKEIVQRQLLDRTVDVFSGKSFDDLQNEEREELDFNDMITVDTDMLSSAFGFSVSDATVNHFITSFLSEVLEGVDLSDTSEAADAFTGAVRTMAAEMMNGWLKQAEKADWSFCGLGEAAVLSAEDAEGIVDGYLAGEEFAAELEKLQKDFELPEGSYPTVLRPMLIEAVRSTVEEFDRSVLDGHEEEMEAAGLTLGPDQALFNGESVAQTVYYAAESPLAATVTAQMAAVMTAAGSVDGVRDAMSRLPDRLTRALAGSVWVDGDRIARSFQFNMDEEQLMRLMTAYSAPVEERSAESNLVKLGYADPEDPATIMVYLKDFAGKERYVDFLKAYNKQMEDAGEKDKTISYTDIAGVLMSSVKTIVDAITYVLIAFVSISLIVSSIMIGVITLISVQERTKEIGILRAIGASKKNVSSMFNAETVIIGFISGFIGTGVTYLLCIPINSLLHRLTGVESLSAELPVPVALTLILISVLLTLVAGIIPSGSAAKKDPVVALRTE